MLLCALYHYITLISISGKLILKHFFVLSLKFYYPHNSNDLNIKFRPAIELNLNEYLYPFISHFIFLSAYGQEHFLEKLLFEFSIFLIVTFQISLNSPRVKLNGNAVCKVCQFTQHKPLSARLRFSSSFILTIFVKMAGSIIRFRMNSLVYSFNIAWIKLGYCNGKYLRRIYWSLCLM